MSRTPKDLTDQRFGRLVAIRQVGSNSSKSRLWLCRCDCGNEKVIPANQLYPDGKSTRSCGCLRSDSKRGKAKTHGKSRTPLHRVWLSIVRRCTTPSNNGYPNYGGRGILICDQWRHDIQAFYDHVTQLPDYGKKGYSIDRIDNDGNYEPGNVRWATRTEQNRNTRRNVLIAFNGKTQCLQDWANELELSPDTITSRIKAGWDIERALRTPARKYGDPEIYAAIDAELADGASVDDVVRVMAETSTPGFVKVVRSAAR